MPELPEVETVVRQLNHIVLHKKIHRVIVTDKKVVEEKVSTIAGSRILRIRRHGKYIIIDLSNALFLLIHLGMTGHFHYQAKEQDEKRSSYEKYAVAFFYFDDRSLLTYNSIRKFERMRLLTAGQLKEKLRGRKNANIKTLLMDQKIFAGIGNIYAQEALYHAKIDPRRKAGSLSEEEIKNLYLQLHGLLKKAIEHKGSTVDNYSHMEGSGSFQNYLAVYGRKSCPKGHELKKINIGGRGTSFCIICQK